MINSRKGSDSRRCPVCGNPVVSARQQDGREAPCPECGHASWFRIQEFDNTVLINVVPPLDLEYADIDRVVNTIVRRRPPGTHVIVNLSLVQFIGSTFLAKLIVAKRLVGAVNGKLILCGLEQIVAEVFRITKLDGFFEILDDEPGLQSHG